MQNTAKHPFETLTGCTSNIQGLSRCQNPTIVLQVHVYNPPLLHSGHQRPPLLGGLRPPPPLLHPMGPAARAASRPAATPPAAVAAVPGAPRAGGRCRPVPVLPEAVAKGSRIRHLDSSCWVPATKVDFSMPRSRSWSQLLKYIPETTKSTKTCIVGRSRVRQAPLAAPVRMQPLRSSVCAC